MSRHLHARWALAVLAFFAISSWGSLAHAETQTAPVVVIGVGGLQWADITDKTPALESLTHQQVGSLVVRSERSYTCPADGWLALNTGTRAADFKGQCRFLLEPRGSQAPGWPDYTASTGSQDFNAQLGLFDQILDDGGVTAASIGPGAAIALADTDGRVENHTDLSFNRAELIATTAKAAAEADLLVIDAGSIRDGKDGYTISSTQAEYRAEQIRVIEARVAAILAGLSQTAGQHPTIMLAGLADSGYKPALRVLAISGPGIAAGTLTSPSTRQNGYVLATDLQATVVELLGISAAIPPGAGIGAAATVVPGEITPEAIIERKNDLKDDALHASAVAPLASTFSVQLVALNLLLFAVVAVALKRPAATRIRAWLAEWFRGGPSAVLQRVFGQGELALTALRLVALGIASIPVASYLTNVLPWWRLTPTLLALLGGTLAWVVLIVTVAIQGPWKRRPFGPAAVVAGLTALVLGVDVATGATLQISAVMGVSTLVAGRFYGMNNSTFALFSTASLIVTIVVASPLVRAGQRRLAALVVLAIGAVVVVIDGAPSMGADFGGPPALLPAFMVTALLAAGIRLTWKRVVLVLVVAATASVAISFADWLRPTSERTHLGRFVQTVLDGGLWGVIWRKLDQNISILFGNRPLTILAICGILTVVFVLAKPIRLALTSPNGGEFAWLSRGNPISLMSQDEPMLKPGLVGVAVALGLGLAVNDSGIAIPALGVALGVPLLISAGATWMLGLPTSEPADRPTDTTTPRGHH